LGLIGEATEKSRGKPINGFWLVVLTILKNISQWEGLSHLLWKKQFETTSQD
jgi:hypothetical protein